MAEISKNIKSQGNIYHIIIVIIIIIFSDDTVFFGTNIDQRYIYIKYTTIIALFIILLFITLSKKMKFKRKGMHFAIVMTSCLIISSSLNSDIRLGYFYQIGLIYLSLLIVTYMPFRSFEYCYNKVMSVLAAVSLLGFALYIALNSVLDYFPTIQNTSYIEFHNLFLTVMPSSFYAGMVRNYGVFREPGVFQIYLIIALMFQLFTSNKPNVKVCILYMVTVITTFSTTGYFALLFVWAAFFLKKSRLKEESNKKVIITVVFCIIFAYLFLYTDLLFKEGYGSVFGKLSDIGRSTTSVRLASIIVNLELWLSSPIWGIGLTNLHTQYPSLAREMIGVYTIHNTNTLLVQLAAYGVIYGSLWVYGICRLCRLMTATKMDALLVFIIFNILFIGENITFSLIINVLLFYGFTYIYRKRKEFLHGHGDQVMGNN